MPINDLASGDDRRRVVEQVELVREDHGAERVAWDSELPEDFHYLYDPDVLLVRSTDRARVDEVLDVLNGTGEFDGTVTDADLPLDDSGRDPLPIVRVLLPGRVDGNPRRVPLALDALDARGVNDTQVVATPNHWVHLCGPGNTRLCPASEPSETGLDKPWPGVASDPGLGGGVRVSVVDSGWHAPAGQPLGPTPWLEDVDGDDEQNVALLRPYAGHGTFIAGVVRCLAPGTTVYVERFLTGTGAMLETDMVAQLRQALAREPHLINLSAGAVTRRNHPLLSFEAFWEQDLSQTPNCLLVAAAGNDATAAPLWPAAFDWALGVGSLDRDGHVSRFSNHGPSADVYALGRNLVNAYPDGTYVCHETPDTGDVRVFDRGMARWSGTSFAAPVVVGLIAAEPGADADVFAARDAVLARAGTAIDPLGSPVPALFPPYS
ncbi:S8/S53 family peptidase [Nocardioides sp. LS1]|uniref:S8 family peptidase n=1 Tax=Nocardioides sp. LS1 TaxID=1027620 RepID=UPI000F61CD47|nr:S8/S53 family peptidase [Nocardioides sp. LS1]GCD91280.1 protease [Nocardioides sp. LS1]